MSVQKLMLGTAQFGLPYGVANQNGQVSQTVIQEMLCCAYDAGVSTLDTAIAYGNSEEALGLQNLQKFAVVSKLFELPNECTDIATWVEQQLHASLKRLQIESLEALLFHRPIQLLEPKGQQLYQAMLMLKEQGLVKRIGISMYRFEELPEVIKHFDFDIVQAPMNIFDRRMQTSGLLSKLKGAGVEVHIRSAFLQGVLLMDPKQTPNYFLPWAELFNAYHYWLSSVDVTALQACLSFLNQNSKVDRIIVGVDNLQQLKQIINVMTMPIVKIPSFINSTDEALIDPSRWNI
nr:aldo/keto reductase [uncultured Psychrobacter sp.]